MTWLRTHILTLSAVAVALYASVMYWPMRNILVSQRPTEAVNASNLTLNLLIAFAVVAILGRRIALQLSKRWPRAYPIFRIVIFVLLMAAMINWLTLWGYETRW